LREESFGDDLGEFSVLRRLVGCGNLPGERFPPLCVIPSLVVTEIRQALVLVWSAVGHVAVEYLATTFALSDDGTRDALSTFLTEAGEGIFRGPYLSVRTPFQHVEH
jgi:hypothetical protein